jgi:hypothetical protein
MNTKYYITPVPFLPSQYPVFVSRKYGEPIYVIPMHFNTTFTFSSHTAVHSVENSWFHSISWLAFSTRCCNTSLSHWLTLNISKSSGVPQPKIQGFKVRGSYRPVDWASASCHCSPKVWFRCCLTMRRKWAGAPSSMNHMCCSWRGGRVLANHSSKTMVHCTC